MCRWRLVNDNNKSPVGKSFTILLCYCANTQANAEVPSKRSAVTNKDYGRKWKFSLQCTSVIRRGEGEIQARSDQDRAAAARMLICVVYHQETNSVSPKDTVTKFVYFNSFRFTLSIQVFEGLCTAITPRIYLLYDLKNYVYYIII